MMQRTQMISVQRGDVQLSCKCTAEVWTDGVPDRYDGSAAVRDFEAAREQGLLVWETRALVGKRTLRTFGRVQRELFEDDEELALQVIFGHASEQATKALRHLPRGVGEVPIEPGPAESGEIAPVELPNPMPEELRKLLDPTALGIPKKALDGNGSTLAQEAGARPYVGELGIEPLRCVLCDGKPWAFGCRYCGRAVCDVCGSEPEGICNLCASEEA